MHSAQWLQPAIPARTSGGWIGAYGSLVIDSLRWWAGEIESISGICRTEIPRRPDANGVDRLCTAEDSFTACFTFKNGATAIVDTSSAAAVYRPDHPEIFGSEGMLAMSGLDLELKRADKADQHIKFIKPDGDPHEPSFIPWAGAIRDAVRDKWQITPSFRDGVACAELMDKLRANTTWTIPTV